MPTRMLRRQRINPVDHVLRHALSVQVLVLGVEAAQGVLEDAGALPRDLQRTDVVLGGGGQAPVRGLRTADCVEGWGAGLGLLQVGCEAGEGAGVPGRGPQVQRRLGGSARLLQLLLQPLDNVVLLHKLEVLLDDDLLQRLHLPLELLLVRPRRLRTVALRLEEFVGEVLLVGEEHPQPGHLLLQRLDLGLVRPDVGRDLPAYPERPGGVLQSVQRLLVAREGRRDAHNEDGLGVAAEGVLEQPRELGVAVGHEPLGRLPQTVDAVAQRQQALVDVGALLLAQAAALPRPLTAGQVHEEQLRVEGLRVADLREIHLDDRVRARGVVVGAGRGDGPPAAARLQQPQEVGVAGHPVVRQLGHRCALRGVLEDPQALRLLDEQVAQLLVVQLHEGHPQGVPGPQPPQHLLHHHRHHALVLVLLAVLAAEHGVALARASHPVRQDRRVEAREEAVDGVAQRLVDLHVPVALQEHPLEVELQRH